MKKFLRDKSSHIIFICVLLIQIIFMIFYCDMKKGYFVDELWSYGLSNSYYHAQIWEDGALDNPEISPDMFKEYMTVNEGEAFKFGSVIYNQTHDSHPPLFYMVLHAISSCFPGQFSKWFGLIPNLLYYAVTIIFLYKIGNTPLTIGEKSSLVMIQCKLSSLLPILYENPCSNSQSSFSFSTKKLT